MKRFLKWLFLPVLIATLLFCVSCQQDQEQHEHTFSNKWSYNSKAHWHAATCEHINEKASYGAHEWGNPVVLKNPSCSEAGSRKLTCSVCGATKTETISATGHDYATEWSNDETYHWHASKCEHLGLKGSFEPHTWDSGVVTVEPTCTTEGSATYTCSVCGAKKAVAVPCHTFATTWTSNDYYHWHAATCEHTSEKTALEEHSWGSIVKNANGTITYTCKICGKTVTESVSSAVSMITAGPGEDSSESAVISWHSTTAGSSLEYRRSDTEEWTSVSNSNCNQALSAADWHEGESAKHYRCKVYLNNLTEASTYLYRIRDASGNYSNEAVFRTAAKNTTYFQFMWLSDLHVLNNGDNYIDREKELINYANNNPGVDVDFVLFTGDMVNTGKYYTHWNAWSDSGLLNNMTYAFVCGNHEYYDGTRDSEGEKVRETNAYYKDVCAYPANNTAGGKSVLDSNYWFIWNRVLFVCIDNFPTESNELRSLSGASLSAQKAWFKEVVKANEGNYDYLIFAQHLPWFKRDTAACEYGNYDDWYAIFDEYKVDFALSSDEHTYRRTYALYNDNNSRSSADNKAEMIGGKVSKGTVYVTSCQTEGSSISSNKNTAASGLKYVEFTGTEGGVGGVYFTVTPTEMTLHLLGAAGREKDTITVLKKDR